jgi:hypothetical protein
MSTKISQTIIKVGTVPAVRFSPGCQDGDTQKFHVVFPHQFPKPTRVRVIITASNLKVVSSEHNAAVVGIAEQVDERDFFLVARNSDCSAGLASFNWMAVAETPGEEQRSVGLRMGVVQPRHFQPDCVAGDSQLWGVNFSTPFDNLPTVLLTASNLNVRNGNVAAVGIARDAANNRFTLAARNSDCAEGDCAFYYVAISEKDDSKKDLWVDSGEIFPHRFSSDCQPGDWIVQEVAFSEPFLTPPVVLVTANDQKASAFAGEVAAVGIARDVTTHGFTLAARNSGCSDGEAGFYWVAIGCDKGCG